MREQLTPDIYPEAELKFGFKRNENKSYTWYYFNDYNFTIMAPTKCGSSSIRQFIWMNEIEDRITIIKQYQVVGDAYVVVRDPISRFCSLWRSKCRDKANLKDKRVYGMSPVELMSHIENGHKDTHWTPQVKMIGHHKPTLIPLEYLNEWWSTNIGLGELGYFNTTEGEVDIDDDLRARILAYYADDAILHDRALCDFLQDKTRN